VITLYTWSTPNGRKASIMFEEIGLPYAVKAVDLSHGEQFAPDFLRISPNNKIPAIVDDAAIGGPLAIFESGAVLTYLADRSGRLLAPEGPARYRALEWLHWSIGGLGPMLGQLVYFARRCEPPIPLPVTRFTQEADRLLGVLDRRLNDAPFLAGDDYSIADIAAYTWALTATTALSDVLATALVSKPGLHRWLAQLSRRPAVTRGLQIPPDP